MQSRYAETMGADDVDDVPELAAVIHAFVVQLEREGIADPLGTSFTLVVVLNDLCTVAGIPTPADIRRRLCDEPPF